MAHVIPEGWQALREAAVPAAMARELETLAQLAAGLPETCTVFHGVSWNRVEGERSLFGAIDFAVVGPHGRVLLIEQQTGFLTEGEAPSRNGRSVREVHHRLGESAVTVRRGLEALDRPHKPVVEVLLYLPDSRVRDPGSVGLDPARVIDAGRREALLPTARALLEGASEIAPERIHRYLADALRLSPDVGAVAGEARALYTRLAGGLAEWARRIEMSPHRLRVIGTAGSGKTQLALAVYRDALAAGRRPLYVCFNRPLADHFAALVPAGGEVASYNQLCNRVVKSSGITPDYSQPQAYERVEAAFASLALGDEWRFDELLIDEGQDFSPAWRDALLRLLRADGRAWWLEDPQQKLYEREPVPLPGWITLRSDTNYRSPREVVRFLNQVPGMPAVEAGSPVQGEAVSVEIYETPDELVERTRRAVTAAIGQGFHREQIAVLSFHGRERSALAGLDRLGPMPLRRFTGEYDLLGSPRFAPGELLFETVYRFKGQSAPCVVLTEIDFQILDDAARRKLFVGITRATLKATLVLTPRAAQALGLSPT